MVVAIGSRDSYHLGGEDMRRLAVVVGCALVMLTLVALGCTKTTRLTEQPNPQANSLTATQGAVQAAWSFVEASFTGDRREMASALDADVVEKARSADQWDIWSCVVRSNLERTTAKSWSGDTLRAKIVGPRRELSVELVPTRTPDGRVVIDITFSGYGDVEKWRYAMTESGGRKIVTGLAYGSSSQEPMSSDLLEGMLRSQLQDAMGPPYEFEEMPVDNMLVVHPYVHPAAENAKQQGRFDAPIKSDTKVAEMAFDVVNIKRPVSVTCRWYDVSGGKDTLLKSDPPVKISTDTHLVRQCPAPKGRWSGDSYIVAVEIDGTGVAGRNIFIRE